MPFANQRLRFEHVTMRHLRHGVDDSALPAENALAWRAEDGR